MKLKFVQKIVAADMKSKDYVNSLKLTDATYIKHVANENVEHQFLQMQTIFSEKGKKKQKFSCKCSKK